MIDAVVSDLDGVLVESGARCDEARRDPAPPPPSPRRRSTGASPAPDVYFEAARRFGVDPARAVAVEDSANGIRSAHAAGMTVVAVPNATFPPERDALDLAVVVGTTPDVTPALVLSLAGG